MEAINIHELEEIQRIGGNPNDIVIIKDDGTEEKLNTNKK